MDVKYKKGDIIFNADQTEQLLKYGKIIRGKKRGKAYSDGTSTRKSYTNGTLDTTLHQMFNLAPGITKFRVYMWVEGQDVDCENSASGAYLTFKLGFKLDNEG